MITKMFKPQLGKSIEVYINNMVVKSKVVSEHVKDLGDIFEILRKHKLRLNVSKCSFGVGSGKFLGYMVTYRGRDQSRSNQGYQQFAASSESKGSLKAYQHDCCPKPFYFLISKQVQTFLSLVE